MVGQTISHYQVLERIGEGGMGVVYKARDTHLDRLVALKVLPPERVGDPDRNRRFVREAKAASALNHPNIVTIYDIDKTDGVLFIAMEYIDGQTLDTLIPSTGMPVEAAADCVIQVADALSAAHAAGITHRDLKPANIMLTGGRRAKVLDFGLAKLVESGEAAGDAPTRSMETQTEGGRLVGTIPYMSPEQAMGRPLDHRTDIFSLGVVLYQMLTGELPFRAPHWVAVLEQILHMPTPALRTQRPALPESVEKVVLRATAKNPDERYQSMQELSLDLRSLDTAGHAETRLGARPSRRRAGALAAAALVLMALAVWSLRGPLSDAIARWMLPARKQIAVLPFANIGAAAANQTLCEGILETLSTKLSQLQNYQQSLSVVPASEVRDAKLASAREARRIFGVNLAITGSLQPLRDAIRVTINLVDASTLRQISSRVTDVPAGDLTALQDDVFVHAAALLDLELTPAARQALSAGQTRVPEAYSAYIQGVGHLARFDIPENVDRAVQLLQQAVRQDPSYALAYAALGEACWREYRLTRESKWAEEAQANCLHAVQLDKRLPNVHVTLGMVYRETGQAAKALEELEAALRLDRVNADAHRYLGRTYEDLGKTKEAEATFKRAIALRPDLWTGYWDLAAYYTRRARYDEAAAQFLEVIRLVPDHDRAYSSLGGIYYYQKKFAAAAAMFQKSLAIRPTPQAYSNLGGMYVLQQRYAEAVPTLENAVRNGAVDRQTWGNLAEAYSASPALAAKAPDAYRRAAELAEKQLSVNPKDASVRASLAGYLVKLGRRDEALAQIERARKLAPDEPSVLFRSALVYEQAGDRGRALTALGSAIVNGYSMAEIQGARELSELRNDPRYKVLVQRAAAR